jgi:uncharacterized membrane protein YccC
VVVLFDLFQPQGWRLGLVRLEDVALGVAVSLVVAVLLWPRGARGQLRSALVALFRADAICLDAAFGFLLGRRSEREIEAALAAGIDPASGQGRLVLADLVGRYAQTFGTPDTPDYRSQLLIRLQAASDPRVERYWHLLATINGWPTPPTLAPVFEWFIQALQHHPDPMTTPA